MSVYVKLVRQFTIVRFMTRLVCACLGICVTWCGMWMSVLVSCCLISIVREGGNAVPVVIGLLGCMLIILVGLFMIIKLPAYLFACYGVFEKMIASVLEKVWSNNVSRGKKVLQIMPIIIVCVIAMVILYFHNTTSNDVQYPDGLSMKSFKNWSIGLTDYSRIPLAFPYELRDALKCDSSAGISRVAKLGNFLDGGMMMYSKKSALGVDYITEFIIIRNVVYGVAMTEERNLFFSFDSNSGSLKKYKSKEELDMKIRELRTNEIYYKATSQNWFERAWSDYWTK